MYRGEEIPAVKGVFPLTGMEGTGRVAKKSPAIPSPRTPLFPRVRRPQRETSTPAPPADP